MKTRLIGFRVSIFMIASALGVVEAARQNPVPLTNDDVISLKRAGIGDEVIIQKISSGPTKFSTDAADLIALKNGGISDAVIAAMLKLSSSHSKPETNSDSPTELRKRAEAGEIAAQRRLSLIYSLGLQQVPRDEIEAMRWLRRAAEAGDATSQWLLGSH